MASHHKPCQITEIQSLPTPISLLPTANSIWVSRDRQPSRAPGSGERATAREVQAELEELLATGTELTANRHAELTRKAY